MDGKEFLTVAKLLVQQTGEAFWRTAAGRAYYALLLEGRESLRRWGFPSPPREQIHRFVRLRFLYAGDSDLRTVAHTLEDLGKLRNRADYELTPTPLFHSPTAVQTAIPDAEQSLNLLQQVEADPARVAAAVATIQAAFP